MDMAHGLRCLVLAALVSAALPSAAGSLVLDPDPVADLTYAGIAYAAAPLPDGSVVVAGDLDRFGAVRARGLARLRPDGSGDPGFHVECASLHMGGRNPCAVRSLLALDDGAVVIAGWIGEIDGAPRQGIARLRADGRLDPAWAPALPDAEHATVLARHATWLLATDRSQRLHRIELAPPGAVDPAFAPEFAVFKAAVDIRGRVFVGANLQQQVARLDGVDGSVDPDWDNGAANPLALHIAYDAGTDRLFAVSGDAGFPNRYRIVRLDPQNSPGFEPAWSAHIAGGGAPQPVRFSWIRSLLARDGRVVVSGKAEGDPFSTTWVFDAGTGALLVRTPEGGVDGFQALAIDGAGRVLAAVETADFVDTLAPGGSSLVRLDSTLRIDATFAARTRHTGDVRGAASRPDGSFAIIGEFSRVGDVPRDGLARFDASLRLLPDWRAPAAIAGEQGFVRGTGLVVTDALLDEAGRLLIAGYASNLGIDYEYAIYRLDATTGIAGVPWASFRSATYDGPLVLAPSPGNGTMFVGGSGLRRLCGALADSVVRLRTDGPCSSDPSFGLSADGQVDALRPCGRRQALCIGLLPAHRRQRPAAARARQCDRRPHRRRLAARAGHAARGCPVRLRGRPRRGLRRGPAGIGRRPSRARVRTDRNRCRDPGPRMAADRRRCRGTRARDRIGWRRTGGLADRAGRVRACRVDACLPACRASRPPWWRRSSGRRLTATASSSCP